MKFVFSLLIFSVLFVAATVANESSYSGQEMRNLKALSQEEVDGFLEGKGMGFAKVAELNHYPGPSHVLALREELALTETQTLATENLFSEMQEQAIQHGEILIEKEKLLEQSFSSASISENDLSTLLNDIGDLKAKIRFVHLNAHLKQRAMLSEQQIQHYDELRGYNTSASSEQSHSHQHHLHH